MTRRSMLAGLAAVPMLPDAASARSGSGLDPLALADAWIGRPRAAASLRGRAVLIDIFTFECINCVRVTPNLKRLYATYARADLEIVAVHTPEVPSYQSSPSYVAREARAASLPWPIALDNHYRIWNAYGASAWPTQLLFDRHGRLHATIVGDRRDDEVNAAVESLLRR